MNIPVCVCVCIVISVQFMSSYGYMSITVTELKTFMGSFKTQRNDAQNIRLPFRP